MDQKLFDELIEQSAKKKLQILQNSTGQTEEFELKPAQAASIERMLNQEKQSNNLGYLLMQIRRPDEILYKSGYKKQQIQTFGECEQKILLQFYKQLDVVKNKISNKQFHYFLTLEQLRRHPLSKYFMAIPDPLWLELYDLSQKIHQQLDIRTIANKVLRRKYKTADDFEVDMVTMIHNFRLSFLNHKQMFDISIKFEMLFWDIYRNQVHSNKEDIQTFKYYKQRCTAARKQKPKVQKYTLQKRKKLALQFNMQKADIKKKIINSLQNGSLKSQKKSLGGGVDIGKFKDDFFFQLQAQLKKQGKVVEERPKSKEKTQKIPKQKIAKQIKQVKIIKSTLKQKKLSRKQFSIGQQDKKSSQDEIYYGDSEQQIGVQRRQELNVTRKAVQQVMDLINMEQAFFDSDDYD